MYYLRFQKKIAGFFPEDCFKVKAVWVMRNFSKIYNGHACSLKPTVE